jgi:hypothetical protein
MLLEDFTMDHPDLQPWDPRIKNIVVQEMPHWEHGGWADAYKFIIFLHCQQKIGWAVTAELIQTANAEFIISLMRKEAQYVIDSVYKKFQEEAGGAVDILGKPIKKFKLAVAWHVDQVIDAVSMVDEFEVVQMSDEEQYQMWCKQAESLQKEGFTYIGPSSIIPQHVGFETAGNSTGSIVQRNLKKLFPGLVELVTCPVCKNKDATIEPQQMQLDRAIIHLNDTHSWTREDVADWLESLDVDIAMKEENV